MQKLSLALLVALAPSSVCLAQDQPKISLPPGTLVFDATPVIEKKDGATITIATDKSEYAGGDDIRLDVALANTGGKPITILQEEAQDIFFVEITDSRGKALPKKPLDAVSSRLKLYGGEPLQVKPGQTKKASIWLDSFFDLSRIGSYKITVYTPFRIGTTGNQYISIKSEPITIKIKSYPHISEWR